MIVEDTTLQKILKILWSFDSYNLSTCSFTVFPEFSQKVFPWTSGSLCVKTGWLIFCKQLAFPWALDLNSRCSESFVRIVPIETSTLLKELQYSNTKPQSQCNLNQSNSFLLWFIKVMPTHLVFRETNVKCLYQNKLFFWELTLLWGLQQSSDPLTSHVYEQREVKKKQIRKGVNTN